MTYSHVVRYRLHEHFKPSDTARSRALIDRMCTAGRAEPQASAARLDAIAELFELRRAERGEREDWAVDTWAAVGAEVATAFRISLAMAGSNMRYASFTICSRRFGAGATPSSRTAREFF